MIYLRGHPNDFNSYAETLQDPIWSYKSAVNFYKQFEDFHDNSNFPKQHFQKLYSNFSAMS